MNSIARPRSRRSSSRIAITSACVVTSSAVVGSSASSSRGSVSSAAAIMTRCSRPPDSSCGYCAQPPLAVLDADLAEHLGRAPAGVGAAHAAVGAQRLGHEVADRAHRVGVRARRPGRPSRPRPGMRAARRRAARSTSRPSNVMLPVDHGARRQDPRDRARGHRLARARLADQADRLAGRDRERHAAQHRPLLALHRQRHVEVLDLEQRASPLAGLRPIVRAARRAG